MDIGTYNEWKNLGRIVRKGCYPFCRIDGLAYFRKEDTFVRSEPTRRYYGDYADHGCSPEYGYHTLPTSGYMPRYDRYILDAASDFIGGFDDVLDKHHGGY